MADYTALDEAILLEIRAGNGRNTFGAMAVRLETIAASMRDTKEPWRVIDRRLQALRKCGVIKCIRLGRSVSWSLVPASQPQKEKDHGRYATL